MTRIWHILAYEPALWMMTTSPKFPPNLVLWSTDIKCYLELPHVGAKLTCGTCGVTVTRYYKDEKDK